METRIDFPRYFLSLHPVRKRVELSGTLDIGGDETVERVFLVLGHRELECAVSPFERRGRRQVGFQARFVTKTGFKYVQIFADTGSGRRVRVGRRLLAVCGRLRSVGIPKSVCGLEPGLNLVGLFRYELGIGEAARLNARALEAAKIPHAKVEAPFVCNAAPDNREFEGGYAKTLSKCINLFHFNAPEMRAVHQSWPGVFRNGQYNIGFWFWELSRLPDSWKPFLKGLDEIWVASEIVREVVSRVSPVPVYNVGLPVVVPGGAGKGRLSFGLPEDKFLLLCTYDLNSYSSRKNPEGVIEAFIRASARNPNLHLVLKVNHPEHYPHQLRELQARFPENATILAGTFSRGELSDLQACCDAFISLHRGEGFGLNIAECMALGKPVIATAYSGNMEFMTAGNSCPVDYSMVRIEETEGSYEKAQEWAEPSIPDAVDWILKLAEDPAFYEGISKQAKADIAEKWSPERIGERLNRHYQRILSEKFSG